MTDLGKMDRRKFLKQGALATAATAVPVRAIAAQQSKAEQIRHHKDELMRLIREDCPSGVKAPDFACIIRGDLQVMAFPAGYNDGSDTWRLEYDLKSGTWVRKSRYG